MARMHALAHSFPVASAWKRITGKTLGERLREAREAAGLTQDDAGAKIGRNGQTLWRWEHGRNEPNASDVAQLANVYGVPPHVLLDWRPKTLATMHPELRRFLASDQDPPIAPDERMALMTMPLPEGVEPTYRMFDFFLLSIRAGRPADIAAESAHVSADAERRGDDRGWKDPLNDDDDNDPKGRPRRRN
jgi:transcriptional regulator with XRE-family HTH domain